MFSIDRHSHPFETYTLLDQTTPACLEVVPERGGIITRWQVQGQELLYMDTDRFLDASLSVRGGIPILFPICGNLPDNTYTLNGQSYLLKQHGFARDLPWQVLSQESDQALSLTIGLDSNPQTRAVYPFDFQLRFTYRLVANRLILEQQIQNRSAVTMPFAIGFHPYFAVSAKDQLRFEIPADRAIDHKTQQSQPFFNTFDFEQAEIDWAFLDPNAPIASVADLSRHSRLSLESSPEFSTLVFWTLKGKEFYCLEPWSAPRNAINTGDRLQYLDPGDTLSTQICLTADFN